MLVYMLKDLEKVGLAGTAVKVTEGFANNFLIPKGFAKLITAGEEQFLTKVAKNKAVKKEAISTKMGVLAERINQTQIQIKKRAHDDGKLYGSVGAEEIVDALKDKGIMISKKQIEFGKSVKTLGEHQVTIKINAKVNANLTIKVIENKII